MKSGPLLFLGVFATLAVSWTSMVLAPQLQIGRMGPKPMATGALYPAARPGLAEQGREVYRQNGCAYCHSQQVMQTGYQLVQFLTDPGTNTQAVVEAVVKWKSPAISKLEAAQLVAQAPVKLFEGISKKKADAVENELKEAGAKVDLQIIPTGPDIQRGWGSRQTVAQDFLSDYPVLTGNQRVGPDLANVGVRQPNPIWQLRHLYNPRLEVKGSIMPRYEFLFEKRRLQPGQRPSPNALPPDTSGDPNVEIIPKPEALALVAYLQSLQANVPLFEAPLKTAKAEQTANGATNAPTQAPTP